jgi:hypothetical protein
MRLGALRLQLAEHPLSDVKAENTVRENVMSGVSIERRKGSNEKSTGVVNMQWKSCWILIQDRHQFLIDGTIQTSDGRGKFLQPRASKRFGPFPADNSGWRQQL